MHCLESADAAHLDYTIDCSSFSSKAHGNTCNEYGTAAAWGKIINRPLPDWYADMKLGIFIHWVRARPTSQALYWGAALSS